MIMSLIERNLKIKGWLKVKLNNFKTKNYFIKNT